MSSSTQEPHPPPSHPPHEGTLVSPPNESDALLASTPPPPPNNPPPASYDATLDPEDEAYHQQVWSIDANAVIKFHTDMLMPVFLPVFITMSLVVLMVKSFQQDLIGSGGGFGGVLVYQESASDSVGDRVFGVFLNVLIFVGILVATTFLMVCLYKYRCTKVIWGYLIFSSTLLLGSFGLLFSVYFLQLHNLPLDYISLFFMLWNFAAVGVLAVYWKGPLGLQQAYLVTISVLLATVLSFMAEWTGWAILIVMALYDLYAVLAPNGPLRYLVETAQERNEDIPGLVYSAAVWYTLALPALPLTAGPILSHLGAGGAPRKNVKLGLGDFIFYSVLIGRAALFDWTTVFSCFVAILMGLALTVFLLGVFRRALPALPLSIFFGAAFYILGKLILLPFAVHNAIHLLVV